MNYFNQLEFFFFSIINDFPIMSTTWNLLGMKRNSGHWGNGWFVEGGVLRSSRELTFLTIILLTFFWTSPCNILAAPALYGWTVALSVPRQHSKMTGSTSSNKSRSSCLTNSYILGISLAQFIVSSWPRCFSFWIRQFKKLIKKYCLQYIMYLLMYSSLTWEGIWMSLT